MAPPGPCVLNDGNPPVVPPAAGAAVVGRLKVGNPVVVDFGAIGPDSEKPPADPPGAPPAAAAAAAAAAAPPPPGAPDG